MKMFYEGNYIFSRAIIVNEFIKTETYTSLAI